MEIFSLVLAIIAIITAGVSLFFSYQNYNLIKKFFGDEKIKEDILENLKNYFEEVNKVIDDNKSLDKRINILEEMEKEDFASYSVRKFNPYEESGGDLSFCITMLNRQLNGIMMTSLHGREQTRIYVRKIQNGEANVELLYDEKETLKEALSKIKK